MVYFRGWGRWRRRRGWHCLLHMPGWNIGRAQWNCHLWQVWTRCLEKVKMLSNVSGGFQGQFLYILCKIHDMLPVCPSRVPSTVPLPHHWRLCHWLWWQVALLRVWARFPSKGAALVFYVNLFKYLKRFLTATPHTLYNYSTKMESWDIIFCAVVENKHRANAWMRGNVLCGVCREGLCRGGQPLPGSLWSRNSRSSITWMCTWPSPIAWMSWCGTRTTRPTSSSATATVEVQESEYWHC